MRRTLAIATAAFAVALAAPLASQAESPAEMYTLNCWGCHGAGAKGIPGTVPRLAHSMGYFLRIPEGRAYLVQVPGVENSALDDAQTAIILNWMLDTFSRAELPPDFKPYTSAEVKAYRAHRLESVIDTRSALAKKLAAQGWSIAAMGPPAP
ncbi:MAG: c-type cytochrome [Candidatus Binataceae bacterium]